MTQNWGVPNQGQQWPGQTDWNRQANVWGTPIPPQGQYPQPGQYPPPPSRYPPAAPQALQAPGRRFVQPGPPSTPQSFGQQPSYGQPGSFQQPPPRKSPIVAVLGGGVFILLLSFFGIALMNYLNADTATPAGGDPTYHQVTNVPEPDYNPPALPQPKTYEQATTWMKNNAFYSQTTPVPTDCVVPYLNATTASTSQLEDHLNELTACLWGVWNSPITAAKFELPRPPVTVYTTEITTPCGKTEKGNAFYCGADQHIYYSQDLYTIIPAKVRTKPFIPEMIMAHEFGHALQGRTGILIAESAWQQKSSEADARVLSRRTEVQADCFSGMFINAVAKASNLTDADFENLKYMVNSIGDDSLTGDANYDGDHGLGRTREAWFTTGLSTDEVSKCNTYTAPASKVR